MRQSSSFLIPFRDKYEMTSMPLFGHVYPTEVSLASDKILKSVLILMDYPCNS